MKNPTLGAYLKEKGPKWREDRRILDNALKLAVGTHASVEEALQKVGTPAEKGLPSLTPGSFFLEPTHSGIGVVQVHSPIQVRGHTVLSLNNFMVFGQVSPLEMGNVPYISVQLAMKAGKELTPEELIAMQKEWSYTPDGKLLLETSQVPSSGALQGSQLHRLLDDLDQQRKGGFYFQIA